LEVKNAHRFIKKITKPMMGFKAFHSAQATIAGIETAHMIRKGQLSEGNALNPIIGLVIFLINRWSCSIILFKYLTWHISIIVANPDKINTITLATEPAEGGVGASKNGKNGAKTCQAFILFFQVHCDVSS
jgi:hypothetical protein